MSLSAVWKQRLAARVPTVHWKIIKYQTTPKQKKDDTHLFYTYTPAVIHKVLASNGGAAYAGACAIRKWHEARGENVEFLKWVGSDRPTCIECKELHRLRWAP